MRLLLDSHIAFWWALSPEKISLPARDEITNPQNDVFVSAVSLWELGLKAAKGKLRIPPTFRQLTQKHGIDSLPFNETHAYYSISLPPIHGDPFDRALVAQCFQESITLVTKDHLLARYGIQILPG